ncbi:adenosine deaminase [Fusibacter bizertensis]|uniref:adenosine deaminase n=1 Tax=Fusibacter bizertensis TaxID=1488331 RepID=A0ABT6NEK3_9FIRM|nr:adenosine deaminase [Fusibacter bizertensis]MDH8678854.1 adenosine deaminase [Fusibacter bizertensis]
MQKLIKENFIKYPKIELHCHLDGSLRAETVLAWLSEYQTDQGNDLDILHFDNIRDQLVAPRDCDSLDTYLKRFDLPIKLLQTKAHLFRATYELMEDAAKENVKYIEIRFAPHLHQENGLTLVEVIESVLSGLKAAEEEFEIKGNLILSYLRNTEVLGIYDMINAGKNFIGKGVVALDLCGGERDRFSSRFEEAFKYGRSLGYEVTIHAGETGIAENIVDAIELLGAKRIGHGVAMFSDDNIRKFVKDAGVSVECCPTSNLQTKAITHMSMHPIKGYFDDGILVTINTDNRTVSDTTVSNEFYQLYKNFDWQEKHWIEIYDKSIDASFADSRTKEELKHFLLKHF